MSQPDVDALLFGVYLDPDLFTGDGYPLQWSRPQWWCRTFGGEEFPADHDRGG